MADSITCPACKMTSYNPDDIKEGYCGHCHDYTGALIADNPGWTAVLYTASTSLPAHYNAKGQWCSHGGNAPTLLGGCPDGCDFAAHYANDGHQDCADVGIGSG